MIVTENSQDNIKRVRELIANYRIALRRYQKAGKLREDPVIRAELTSKLEDKKSAVIKDLTDVLQEEIKAINSNRPHQIDGFEVAANPEGELYLKITEMRYQGAIIYVDELREEFTAPLKVLGKKYHLATVEFPGRD
jgi:hypothetical protein